MTEPDQATGPQPKLGTVGGVPEVRGVHLGADECGDPAGDRREVQD
jgi:hypothetical protein